MRIARPVLILLAGVAMAPLAACKFDNRPLLARGQNEAPAQYAALPQPGGPYEATPQAFPAGAYPAAPPPPAYSSGRVRRIRYEPARGWPYAEQAYGLERTFYDVPPDYGFHYADEEPWVWEAADDSLMFAEPYGDDYRFYYYEPGAAYPYFVEDPGYGYAFGPDGALIALFDVAGALLAADTYDRYYPTAERYWTRGLDLRQAYVRTPHYQVPQTVWAQRAPLITRDQTRWIRTGDSQPAWRDWRARTGQDFVRRYAPDRQRHMAMAQAGGANGRFAMRGARGAPMPRGGESRGRGQQLRMAEARAPMHMRQAPQARFEAPREHARAALQRGRPERAFAAAQAGRNAVFRGPEGHSGGRRGGQGGGHRGGPPEARFAAAQPQPQFHGAPHAFGRGPPPQHFAPAQPHPQAAPAPQAAHGNPHQGGGGGGGHGKGGQGGAKDHGHGHGG